MSIKKHITIVARRAYNSPLKRLLRRMPQPAQKLIGKVRDHLAESEEPFEQIPRVYITLRCNLQCPYCSDGLAYDKSDMQYPRLSGDEWVGIIDELPGNSVIFTGGEPTLHPELPDIINRIRQSHICLYTNLAYNVEKFLNRLEKPIRFFTSFHPNNPGVTAAKSIAALKVLEEHPMCQEIVSHHIIRDPSNGTGNEINAFAKEFGRAGFPLLKYDNQFDVNVYGIEMCNFKKTKTVRCTMDRILIAPDGKRYMCVSKMVRQTSDGPIPLETKLPTMICGEYGLCSPCDEVAEISFDVDVGAIRAAS